MSDQSNVDIRTVDKTHANVSMEVSDKNFRVVLRPLEKNKPGFLPLYRKMLAIKRAFSDFKNAKPEDVDEAVALLKQYMVEPVNDLEKQIILDTITEEEMGSMFDHIMGTNTVPLAKGAA